MAMAWQCHVINVRFILDKGIAAPNLHICREIDSCLRMRELMHIIKDKLKMFNKTKMDTYYEKENNEEDSTNLD